MASPTSSSPSNQPNVAAQRLQHGVGPAPAQQPQNITTEGVQKYLDENESLISTIVENMNANRLKECTQYQARLQQNLMYLAAIADQHPAPQQQQQQPPHS